MSLYDRQAGCGCTFALSQIVERCLPGDACIAIDEIITVKFDETGQIVWLSNLERSKVQVY